MTLVSYDPPVSRLLSLGDSLEEKETDYLALGLGPEHVPALCRLALDADLRFSAPDAEQAYAPIHAWLALGQIGSPDAIATLLTVMGRIDQDDDEWALTELPDIFAAIGPVALPELSHFLADQRQGEWARITCISCFEEIVRKRPAARTECIEIITRQLSEFTQQPPKVNASLISTLLDWRVIDAAPIMEQAFAAGLVDLSIVGDWEEVQIELGLLSKRLTPRPSFAAYAEGADALAGIDRALSGMGRAPARPAAASVRSAERAQQAKSKRKRKQEKQTRRKQRK